VRFLLIASVACATALAPAQAFAQTEETTKSGLKIRPWNMERRVNDQGYTIFNFRYRATASGCEGSQNYEGRGEAGVSPSRWTVRQNTDGGILCTGGQWFYGGSGANAGTPGGSVADLFIRAGKFYRVVR
jgi:hypothetical protein